MGKLARWGKIAVLGLIVGGSIVAAGPARAQMFPQQPQQPQNFAFPMQAGQVDPTRVPPRIQVPEQRVRIIVRPRSPFGF